MSMRSLKEIFAFVACCFVVLFLVVGVGAARAEIVAGDIRKWREACLANVAMKHVAQDNPSIRSLQS